MLIWVQENVGTWVQKMCMGARKCIRVHTIKCTWVQKMCMGARKFTRVQENVHRYRKMHTGTTKCTWVQENAHMHVHENAWVPTREYAQVQ
jgi:hypothetical protein